MRYARAGKGWEGKGREGVCHMAILTFCPTKYPTMQFSTFIGTCVCCKIGPTNTIDREFEAQEKMKRDKIERRMDMCLSYNSFSYANASIYFNRGSVSHGERRKFLYDTHFSNVE